MKELKQQYLFTKKEFLLTKAGVRVISKEINENLEYTIKYEELGFDIIKKREKTAIFPAIVLLFFFLLEMYLLIDAIVHRESSAQIVMWLLSAVFFGLIAGLAFYRTNKDVVYLTGGAKVLELIRDKPSVQIVDHFIQNIHAAMRVRYKNKFAIIDHHLPQEMQIENLRWLKDLGVIDEEEHEELLIQLKNSHLL